MVWDVDEFSGKKQFNWSKIWAEKRYDTLEKVLKIRKN